MVVCPAVCPVAQVDSQVLVELVVLRMTMDQLLRRLTKWSLSEAFNWLFAFHDVSGVFSLHVVTVDFLRFCVPFYYDDEHRKSLMFFQSCMGCITGSALKVAQK